MAQQITAAIAASVVRIDVAVGDEVAPEQQLLTLESMKMEIPIVADVAGRVLDIGVAVGDTVLEGDLLVMLA